MVKLPLKIGKCGQLLDDTLCAGNVLFGKAEHGKSAFLIRQAEAEKEVKQNQPQIYTLRV